MGSMEESPTRFQPGKSSHKTMPAATETEIRSLASFLCVSCGKVKFSKENKIPTLHIENDVVIKGHASIIKFLVNRSKFKELIGNTLEEKGKCRSMAGIPSS